MITILGHKVVFKIEMDSTNNKAKELAKEGGEEGILVITRKQTNGKGRLGRNWQSPKGSNILMSLILRPQLQPEQFCQLSIVSAVTLCEVLQDVTGLEAKIKWPNDIVINGKKVCGILIELCTDVHNDYCAILGIGINVNVPHFPKSLPYATSLYLEGGTTYKKEIIIEQFLKCFEKEYKTFQSTKNILFLKKRYEKNCITLHKTVKLIKGQDEIIAHAYDITDNGALCVQYSDGSKEMIGHGEVSVRGLYEYS